MQAASISVMVFFLVALAIAAAVVMIIAWCKIFRKAGIHPGKFFIPVYGSYLCYRIADSGGLFIGQIIVSVVGSIITTIIASASARSYYGGGAPIAVLVVFIIELIVIGILNILYCINLARSFGKSGGFAVGLIFLFPIFICILGFGSAQYCGALAYRGATAIGTWKCPNCGAENPNNRATCECGSTKP